MCISEHPWQSTAISDNLLKTLSFLLCRQNQGPMRGNSLTPSEFTLDLSNSRDS